MNEKIYKMNFSTIYQLYLKKFEKKNRTEEELNKIIIWLTGYSLAGLEKQINNNVNMEIFFKESPQINPNISLIKGTICGIRIEEITNPLMKKIRILDKLVDELAKGKNIDKILKR